MQITEEQIQEAEKLGARSILDLLKHSSSWEEVLEYSNHSISGYTIDWLPDEVVNNLFKSKNAQIRANIAKYTKSVEILESLSKDSSIIVLREVASNSSTDMNSLKWLLEHPNNYVREYVAGNKSISKDIMIRLSTDVKYRVRKNIALNTTSKDILVDLTNDKYLSIRNIALERIKSFDH